MIRANCRARFTAADFDFVVRTLARSQTDHVSLVDLSERYRNTRFHSRSSAISRGNFYPLRTSADFVAILFLCSGPARFAAGRDRRPQALRLRRVVAGSVFAREPVADDR